MSIRLTSSRILRPESLKVSIYQLFSPILPISANFTFQGFGFVQFETIESAYKACVEPNLILNGSLLTCTAFKEENPPIEDKIVPNIEVQVNRLEI
jgi:RNA recognition motif-containing protein